MRHKPKPNIYMNSRLAAVVVSALVVLGAAFLISTSADASRDRDMAPVAGTFTASFSEDSAIYIDTSGTPSGRLYGPYQVLDLGPGEQGKRLSVYATPSASQAPPTALYFLTAATVKPGEVLTAFGEDEVSHANLVAREDAGSSLTWSIEPGRYLLVFPRQVPPVGVFTPQSVDTFTYTISIE